MKRILLFLFFAFSVICSLLATETDRWSLHLTYHKAEQILGVEKTLYVLYEGNLLAYDTEDQSVRTFDKLNGLSDKGVARFGRSATENCLVLLYNDRNVDLLYDNGDVVNIPQIKNNAEEDIVTRQMNVCGDWAAISTEEGVILLNLPRAEIKGYYRLGEAVNDAFIIGNTLYAGVKGAVIKGNINDNLYDRSQWKTVTEFGINRFVPFGNGAYMLVASDASDVPGLCYLEAGSASGENGNVTAESWTSISPNRFESGSVNGSRIQFQSGPFVMTMSADTYAVAGDIVRLPASVSAIVYTQDGTYWSLTLDNQLQNWRYDAAEKIFTALETKVGGYGPAHDNAYKFRYAGERLLVAGGRMDNSGAVYAPTAMYYENGIWTNLQDTGFILNDGAPYRNVTDMVQDPSDPDHHYVSTTSGLVEFREGRFVAHFNYSNSPLESFLKSGATAFYVVADGLNFDSSGNLWMTNYGVEDAIKILKADGTWSKLSNTEYSNVPAPEKMMFDSKGRVWLTSLRNTSAYTSGIFGLDYRGTIDDTDDDRSYFRSEAVNEDGTECNLQYSNVITEDHDGQLWVGCHQGVFAITDPDDWFTGNFSIYQPKVPRNDGTNYADYLLNGVDVRAIAVDGGNRKWIGTLGSGLYLVSPDGSEVLEHFTAEETPLLSNNIYTLAVHPRTGELMIGTEAGICSYRTDIVPPADRLEKSNIKVYPNPVRPGYAGKLVVTGLTEGAEVKIVTTGHQLVARGNAVGGTFTWDVRHMASGRRVAPGVYYVLIAKAGGGESVATKFVVV